MRLFNRLSDESRSSDHNQTNKVFRGRKSEGKRRGDVADSLLSPRRLGMENLEERQLLAVGAAEYQAIREACSNLELPSSLSEINVIELTDLSAVALQRAVDSAAQTPQSDLLLLRTTADDYVVDLESTAIKINIDSEKYGDLTILGIGEEALVVETTDSNAFTVLDGNVQFDNMLLYNYSSIEYAGDLVVAAPGANATLGTTLAMTHQIDTIDPETGAASQTFAVNQAMTEEAAIEFGLDVNSTNVSQYRYWRNVEGDFNQVRLQIDATLRVQNHYFGYTPARRFAPGVGANTIYDAEAAGYAGWVGTVANMLAYSGWAQQAGFSTTMTKDDGSVVRYDSVEDAVADYFKQNYVDSGAGTARDWSLTSAQILDYFFSGNDKDMQGRNLSDLTNAIEGGGFFMDVDFSKVGGYVPSSAAMIDDATAALRAGKAVTMEVVTTDGRTGNKTRQYVSVWGYYYNPNSVDSAPGTSNQSADYVGLICSSPNFGTYEADVVDNHYAEPGVADPITRNFKHYVDVPSERGDAENYNTYHTYLLQRNGSGWRFATAPCTYLNDKGEIQGASELPQGFQYFGGDTFAGYRYNNGSYVYTADIVGFSWIQQYADAIPSVPTTEEAILSLESMPGNSENVVYLHFAGDAGGWTPEAHPEFDLDGSNGYGIEELQAIEEIWRRVAEDFAPFKINVTTSADVWANASGGVRVVIGGYSDSRGGVSHVGSFGAQKEDNYVFSRSLNLSPKSIAEAATHETGHALGLNHDGYEHNEYYGGNGTWAPIMGSGYGAPITQWSKGDYVNATNREDDVAIIAALVGYRDDDFGDTVDYAEALDKHYISVDINGYNSEVSPYMGTYRLDGYVETRTDLDMFSFVSNGGTYVVDVSGDGADYRFIDSDFAWNARLHSDVENAAFAGKYYAKSLDYTNLNLRVALLDENGDYVLLDNDGVVMKLNYGEYYEVESNNRFYVYDQFGRPVYNGDGSRKEGWLAVDDSTFTTFSHFVTPELEAGKTYYIQVEGVGQGNDATNGYSDYGSLGKYTLSMRESYENFRIDAEKLDVQDLSYASAVDNVLSWQEAFVYSGRRLEDGSTYLGNVLQFNERLSGQTLDLTETLTFNFSRSVPGRPLSAKRFVLDATGAWDTANDQPGITIDANEKFRAVYVDNTTVELYGFTITGGVAETTNVIYLYFGGIDGTGWSGELHPAFDLDGDPTTFNAAELEAINEIYLRVAEDYSPYDVTVTTDQTVFEGASNAIRVVVGGTGNGRGGVAYMNSFGTVKQDCYVFPNSVGNNAKNIAEAISHEVGHTLGLGHDGKDDAEYYGGAINWAPIMGAAYGPMLSQWSKGEYRGATNSQDDLATIAGRIAYKKDDYSNKQKEAAPLSESYIRSGNMIANGLIERTGDVDWFSFLATNETFVVDVVGVGADYSKANAEGYAAHGDYYTNLDLVAELYDADGNLLYTCNPESSLFAHFEANGLEIGAQYFLRVSTTGKGDPTSDNGGYSNYGAVGQYYVTVAPGTLADFVGENRYESNSTKNAVINGAINATKEKAPGRGSDAQANNGGGVYNNYGWLTIGDSVIAGNRALKAGGGVYNAGGEYEDQSQHDGWFYLVNSSIIGNRVTEENAIGGGFYNESGGVATLVNVTIAGNVADYSGGGVQNAGYAELYNVVVAKNDAKYGADVYNQSGKPGTVAYNSLIGNEARNSAYAAWKNGANTQNGGGSRIGTSRGSSVSSPVVVYDPKFVAYREYEIADWSAELWKSWNLRLQGDSPANDLGADGNLTIRQDFGNGYVQTRRYVDKGVARYDETFAIVDLAGQPRVAGASVDAGAYEVLANPDLTGFVPTSAGSDVVNDWESSIVVSRAQDDQTGSVAPFLVDEDLYLNLSFINQGVQIGTDFETTVYFWKYAPTATKSEMTSASKIDGTEVAFMKIKVEFQNDRSLPDGLGGVAATITATNLATGETQTFQYDGSTSYISLENVKIGSIEDLASATLEPGQNEEGYYVFGYRLDSSDALDEYKEDNNFFLTTSYFDVVESPVSINDSIVVTTTEDVVDRYDGKISLREAVEVYAGSFYYKEVALPIGATFESGGVVYAVGDDGKFYVDQTSEYKVYPGEKFSFVEVVETELTWDSDEGAYKNAVGDVVALTNGAKAAVAYQGVEYADALWNDAQNAWDVVDASGNPLSVGAADAESVVLREDAIVAVVYQENVYLDASGKAIAVADGTQGKINGVDVVSTGGVWTRVETTRYDRDAIQATGNFVLADGTEVAVVNGVFRRVETGDVAVVLDGAVVALANGETAVYDSAKDAFIVEKTTEYVLNNGDRIEIDGETLTFAAKAYVDDGGYRYELRDGVRVTLENGYEVVYNAARDAFVFVGEKLAGKISAGSTIVWNGQEYAYKAGVAVVQKVSREANAVVFDASLDGQTFDLSLGELTLKTKFTLDSVDPDGAPLALTIRSESSRLFNVEETADVTIKNFTLSGSGFADLEKGGVALNAGKLTVENVVFSGNKALKGGSIYNAGTLTVVGSAFENDFAQEGGSIYNASGATLVVDGASFSGAADVEDGAAIFNAGNATIQNASFIGGAAERGAAIFNAAGQTVVLDSEFVGQTATQGGAIFNASGATLTVSATTDEGGVVGKTTFSGQRAEQGGAIYNVGNALVENSNFADASARNASEESVLAANGGAIYNAGNATVSASTFVGARAGGVGGAIYGAANPAALKIVGVAFVGNSATSGGAVYAEGGVIANDSVFERNEATDGFGGAIYAGASATVEGDLTAVGNVAAISGGAVYVRDGALTISGSATMEENASTDGAGGAIYAGGNVKVGGELAASGNVAGLDGGAIYAGSDASLGFAELQGNSANGSGGAVYAVGAATFASADLQENAANGDGGAIYAGGAFEVGGELTAVDNGAANGSGGAIYAGGNVKVGGAVDLTGNAADGDGGAIYAGGSATFNGALTATDNVSTDGRGGAVFANDSAIFAKSSAGVVDDVAISGNEAGLDGGAIYAGSELSILGGDLTAIDNEAGASGGAIYAGGSARVLGSATLTDNAAGANGGAIYALGAFDVSSASTLTGNAAGADGGAIYAGDVALNNALIAQNVAGGFGGAIYTADATLVNVTVADNVARDAGGLYVGGNAFLYNAILANNVATGADAKGVDLFTAVDAKTVLVASLLFNVAKYGDVKFDLFATDRSILGVDPEFVDPENGDYRLKAASPAINAGGNDWAVAYATDLDGNDRVVGLTIDGVVRSVDMGAYEYQTPVAPDLAIQVDGVDYWQAGTQQNEEGAEIVEQGYFIAGEDVCFEFGVENVGDGIVLDNFAYSVKLVGRNQAGDVVYDKTQAKVNYKSEFENFDWLNVADWLKPGAEANLFANLGVLPAGSYEMTLTIDVSGVGRVYEYGEEDGCEGEKNNVFNGTFNVYEAPSVVVTTESDVVDPTDCLISLREAVQYAGDYYNVVKTVVADGKKYVLDSGEIVTVRDGALVRKVDVVIKDGVKTDLKDGDEFLLNGKSIFYRPQLNGGYFVYENGTKADLTTGPLTYPDGSAVELALASDQYVSFVVDGDSDLNPDESDRYTYRTIVMGGQVVTLVDGTTYGYSNVEFTYYDAYESGSATYERGVFVFDDGSVVEYVDGGTLEVDNRAIGTLETRDEILSEPLTLDDGSTLQVRDGVAISKVYVGTTITFDAALQGKTINLDAAKGAITVDKDVRIDGEDRAITVDGGGKIGLFEIGANRDVEIVAATLANGKALRGAAIVNAGTLTVDSVAFVGNKVAMSDVPSGETLTEGLGGAIYSVGALTVKGGSFTGNAASEFGGAIFSTGETTVDGATFSANSAFIGGAIAAQGGSLAVANATFDGNKADRGGAIYATGVSATDVISVDVAETVFRNNAATAELGGKDDAKRVGGAIYATASAALSFSESATFENNAATGKGGAVYAENAATIVVDGDLIAIGNASAVEGGAIYATGALTVVGAASLTGNEGIVGGAIYAAGGAVSFGGDLTAADNKATNGQGGAIFAADDLSVVGNASLTGNEGIEGGAIYAIGAVSFGGDLTAADNKATDGFGGAVYATGALTVVGAASLTGNEGIVGGAIYATGAVSFGGDLTAANNTATSGQGGAILAGGDLSVVGNASLTGNEGAVGGAILANGAVSFGGDLTAADNKATNGFGGAILAGGDLSVVGNATLTGNEGTEGGAILANGAVSFGGDLTAADNKATNGRGGAILAGGDLSVVGNATLTGNRAGTSGGAIYAGGAVSVGGTTTAENNSGANDAETTSSVYVEEVDGTSCEVTATTEVWIGFGGAIYAGGAVELVGDATFKKNAAVSAGALYANGAIAFGGSAAFEENETKISTRSTIVGGSEEGVVETANESTVGAFAAVLTTGTKTEYGAVTVVGDLTVAKNQAKNAIGGFAAGSLSVGGNVVATGNEAKAGEVGGFAVDGDVEIGGSLTLTQNAAALSAGGLRASGSLAVGGDLIATGNEAKDGFGGAILANGDVSVDGSLTASSNNATNGFGGAICAGGAVSVGGEATLNDNSATWDGGAIYAFGAVSVGDDLTAANNGATDGSGGAIYAGGAVSVGGEATLNDNSATWGGGAIYAFGAVSVGGDLTAANNNATSDDGGAILATGDVSVDGNATLTGNRAGTSGGAIYADGAVVVEGDLLASSNEAKDGFGGAIAVAESLEVRGRALLSGNSADKKGGAIYAGGSERGAASVSLRNALLAGNVANEEGGAIYADDVSLVSATVADNAALNGGGIYVRAAANLENTILAGNVGYVDGEPLEDGTVPAIQIANDLYVESGAVVTPRNSLVQNVENVGEVAIGDWNLQADYRCIFGVDPEFVDAANGDYSLKETSPAINAGSNDFVGDLTVDVAGNVRVVGMAIDEVVRSIDMGAYEYQTAIAPDLTFGDAPVAFWFASIGSTDRLADVVPQQYFVEGCDAVLEFQFKNVGLGKAIDKFGLTLTVESLDGSGAPITKTYRYQPGADYCDWLKVSDWLDAGETFGYEPFSLGQLDAGQYKLTLTIDSQGEIYEDASNNVYETTFDVYERPSVVVTTTRDVVDPFDGEISLREAAEIYAGPTWISSKFLASSGGSFLKSDDLTRIVVDEDGVATVDARTVSIDGGDFAALNDGDRFAYGFRRVAATQVGNRVYSFAYPDGTTATFESEPGASLTLTFGDGSTATVKNVSAAEYRELTGKIAPSVDYVDVFVASDGTVKLLTEVTQDDLIYDETFAVFREHAFVLADGTTFAPTPGDQIVVDGASYTLVKGGLQGENGRYVLFEVGRQYQIGERVATYMGANFVLPNEALQGFGETFVCENGKTVSTALEAKTFAESFETVDGERVQIVDGVETFATYVGSTIAFDAAKVGENAEIVLDAEKGPITFVRSSKLDASNIDLTVSGGGATSVFVVGAGLTVEMNDLRVVDGRSAIGGGLTNYGTTTLNEVAFVGNAAVGEIDATLTEGAGGAIYNAGSLTVQGGFFSENAATYYGGAICSVGELAIVDSNFLRNESSYYGGAIYMQNGGATIDDSTFSENVGAYGGAIAVSADVASASLRIANSLVVGNAANGDSANVVALRGRTVSGGAILAVGSAASVSLTNVTVADNAAISAVKTDEGNETFASVGGAIVADGAKLDVVNSIVATNQAVSGVDLALLNGATATVRASLIGVGDDCGAAPATDAAARSFVGTTDAPIDPDFDKSYRLNPTSPALNAGRNALAVATDGTPLTEDFYGGARIVGVALEDGTVYAVDMGAVESASVVAPDLTFGDNPLTPWFASIVGDETRDDSFVEGWDVRFSYEFGNYGTGLTVDSFKYSLVVADENGNVVKTLTGVYGDGTGAFLGSEDWLRPTDVVSGVWNLGGLEAGRYKATLTLDVDGSVVELDETNNAYEFDFGVAERPSLVVTTETDVVDAFDGEVSLREAISYVAKDGATTTSQAIALTDAQSFALNDGGKLLYVDGKLSVVREIEGETTTEDAEIGVGYNLADGTRLLWNGDETATLVESLGQTITFAEGVFGKTIALDGELAVDRSLTIDGTGANVSVSGKDATRIANVSGGESVEVSIFDLTFANGAAAIGGAIYNAAKLTLTGVAFNANAATVSGGAIYNAGSLTATNATFADNAAFENGGAVHNVGVAKFERAEALAEGNFDFQGNEAKNGGAVYNRDGSLTLTGVAFAQNNAFVQGGALYNAGGDVEIGANASFVGNRAVYGGAFVNYQGEAIVANATFVANVATESAGAIDNYGKLVLNATTFDSNNAAVAGGAIYNSPSVGDGDAYEISLVDVSFVANEAGKLGGALYNAAGSSVVAVGEAVFDSNKAESAGAIYNVGAFEANAGSTFSANVATTGGAGAIYNAGTATLTNAKFVGNVAKIDGGAVVNAANASFFATSANFEANEAERNGGAIFNEGTASVSNSVLWKSRAGVGGAIANVAGARLLLRSTTVAANSAATAGGVANGGEFDAFNAIVAGNFAAAAVDLASTGSATLNDSLLGTDEGVGVKPTTKASLTGDAGFQVAPQFDENGALTNADSVNLRLLPTARTVNVGDVEFALDATGTKVLATDLDGAIRVCSAFDAIDMGAYEFQFETPSPVVTTDVDVVDPTDGVISLREALVYAERYGELVGKEIVFAEGVAKIELASALVLDVDVAIDGNGVVLDASKAVGPTRVVEVAAGATVELSNLTIVGGHMKNGLQDRPEYVGGGVYNAGDLTLRNVSIVGNEAVYGGGVYNVGSLKAYRSLLEGNSANSYGGGYSRGDVYFENSTIRGNKAAYQGGGFAVYTAKAEFVGVAIYGNRADKGAGLFVDVNASSQGAATSSTALINCSVVGNVATEAGGGVWAKRGLSIKNSLVVGNVVEGGETVSADVYSASAASFAYSAINAANVALVGEGVATDVDPRFLAFETPSNEDLEVGAWKSWDLTLQVGSPAVDAGSNALVPSGLAFDLAGNARVVGGAVDAGAYEEQGNAAPTAVEFDFGSEPFYSTNEIGAVVATLTGVDENEGDSFEFEIVEGSPNAEYFAIDGDKIVLERAISSGVYEIVVRAIDSGDASVVSVGTLTVYDPEAPSYETPTILSVSSVKAGEIDVFWTVGDDRAKEYVVAYRVGGGDWQTTNALTGDNGAIRGAFEVGDVVDVRVKALASVERGESEWSNETQYVVDDAPEAFNVDARTLQDGKVLTLTVDAVAAAHSSWRIVWGDGSEDFVSNELTSRLNAAHVYAGSGTFAPTLYVDGGSEGCVLREHVVSVAVENVFSAVADAAVDSAAILANGFAVENDATAAFGVAIESTDEDFNVVAPVAESVVVFAKPTTRAERFSVVADARRDAFADFDASDETDDAEIDVDFVASDEAFDEAFLNDLFEN